VPLSTGSLACTSYVVAPEPPPAQSCAVGHVLRVQQSNNATLLVTIAMVVYIALRARASANPEGLKRSGCHGLAKRRAWNPPVGGGVKLRPRKRVAPAGSFAERHGSVGHSGIRGASLAPVRPLAFRSRWGRTRHDVLRKNARPGMLRGKVRGEPAGRGRRPPGYSTVGTVPHGERFTDRRARQLVFDRSQGSTRR
jgi:hypothetical protein